MTPPGAHPSRDAGYPTPPGQIPACAANALGSHLGCLKMKHCCGYGRWTLAGGCHRAAIGAIGVQLTWPFWLRRPSARFQCQPTYRRDRLRVSGHRVVREIAAHNLAEPAPLIGHRKTTQAARHVSRTPEQVGIRFPSLLQSVSQPHISLPPTAPRTAGFLVFCRGGLGVGERNDRPFRLSGVILSPKLGTCAI